MRTTCTCHVKTYFLLFALVFQGVSFILYSLFLIEENSFFLSILFTPCRILYTLILMPPICMFSRLKWPKYHYLSSFLSCLLNTVNMTTSQAFNNIFLYHLFPFLWPCNPLIWGNVRAIGWSWAFTGQRPFLTPCGIHSRYFSLRPERETAAAI